MNETRRVWLNASATVWDMAMELADVTGLSVAFVLSRAVERGVASLYASQQKLASDSASGAASGDSALAITTPAGTADSALERDCTKQKHMSAG